MARHMEIHDVAAGAGGTGDGNADEPLETRTSDRGFDRFRAVVSEYGGGAQVSESSNAAYPGVWLRSTAPVNLNEPDGDTHEVPLNLHARNAWMLARQLAAVVVHHYQGDARPAEALDDARRAVAEITGWGPSVAETLLRRLAHRGFVLVDTSAPAPAALEAGATVQFTAGENVDVEPANGELVALYTPSDTIDQVYIRDDASVDADEHDEDERWFPVGGDDYDDDSGPSTWRELLSHAKDGWRLVRLHRGSVPAGVHVVKEWGVWSTDGTVYQVDPPTEDKAVHEATLLYRGDPNDPEQPGEPGCAPASRYVMTFPPEAPGLPSKVMSGWHRASTWAPPPETLAVPDGPAPGGRAIVERIVRLAGPSGLRAPEIRERLRTGGPWGPPVHVADQTVHVWLSDPEWAAPRERGRGMPFVHRDFVPSA